MRWLRLLLLAGAVFALAVPPGAAGPGPTVLPAPPSVLPAPTGCPEGCAHKPCPVVCLPAVEKVTKVRPCYRCKCQTICLASCAGCGRKPDGCADGCQDGGVCGKPREVRRLIKRFVKEERCETVCKPHTVPCPAVAAPSCPGVIVPIPPASPPGPAR